MSINRAPANQLEKFHARNLHFLSKLNLQRKIFLNKTENLQFYFEPFATIVFADCRLCLRLQNQQNLEALLKAKYPTARAG